MKNGIFAVGFAVLLAGPALAIAVEPSVVGVATSTIQQETIRPVRTAVTEFDGNDYAVDELLKISFNEEESLRIAATEVLGDIGTPRARAALGIVLYSNSMGTVRATAADQLGNLGDGESVFALALALDAEKDAEVRDVITANIEKSLPNVDGPVAVAQAVETDTE
ncbi:MAG TPA: HEAT repeat domain-containing protein [bacterium]|nr:HEAT repeat domain-containing protein [bacterium]